MTLHIITKKSLTKQKNPSTNKKTHQPQKTETKLKTHQQIKEFLLTLVRSCWTAAVFCCRDDCISLLGELLFILCPICISFRLFGYLFHYLVKKIIVYLCFNSFRKRILWLRQEVVKLGFFNTDKGNTCMFYGLVSENKECRRPYDCIYLLWLGK